MVCILNWSNYLGNRIPIRRYGIDEYEPLLLLFEFRQSLLSTELIDRSAANPAVAINIAHSTIGTRRATADPQDTGFHRFI